MKLWMLSFGHRYYQNESSHIRLEIWHIVTIDVRDYPFPPVEQILGMLVWMVREG
jgi:hypothetical protein